MIQFRRSFEAVLTAIALTAAVGMQLTAEHSFKQVVFSLNVSGCDEQIETCSPKLASAWQFFNPF